MNKRGLKIYVADDIHSAGIYLLKKFGYNTVNVVGKTNGELIDFISVNKESLKNFSVLIIRSVRKIGKGELKEIRERTDIKYICTASSGFDNVDYTAAQEMGIKVLNVPDGNFISAAEHTIAMILAISKNICKSSKDISKSAFISSKYQNIELYQKTIGIIGVGRVGSYLARLCRSFGMNVLGNDIKKDIARKFKWIKFRNIKFLIEHSDIVSVHTPLDKTTRNLINEDLMNRMKKGAYLINCARGGIINERVLINKLKSGEICYAGIDVFENEPEIRRDFKILRNVLLTPHQAGKTRESKLRISLKLAERIIKETRKYLN